MMNFLLALGILGVTTSTIYAALVVFCALRFAKRRKLTRPASSLLPSACLSRYTDWSQSLSAVSKASSGRTSEADILFSPVSSGILRWPSPGAWQSAIRKCRRNSFPAAKLPTPMQRYGRLSGCRCRQHEIFVISDSDVSVTPHYLHAVVEPFADQRIGLVTCLYRGVPSAAAPRGVAAYGPVSKQLVCRSRCPGVLVAERLEGMRFALGPTMVVRRDLLNQAGGFTAIGEYHGDNFMLGSLMAAHGHRVVLSTHAIEHHVLNTSFVSSALHQVRWMRGTRFYRPKGHLGTVLTFGIPYGLLAAVVALALHRPLLAAILFGWGVDNARGAGCLGESPGCSRASPLAECDALSVFGTCWAFSFGAQATWATRYCGGERCMSCCEVASCATGRKMVAAMLSEALPRGKAAADSPIAAVDGFGRA